MSGRARHLSLRVWLISRSRQRAPRAPSVPWRVSAVEAENVPLRGRSAGRLPVLPPANVGVAISWAWPSPATWERGRGYLPRFGSCDKRCMSLGERKPPADPAASFWV